MDINKLLQDWETRYSSTVDTVSLQVNLPLKQAARIKALSEMYSGCSEQQIISDLLGVALEQLEAALPYIQSKEIIGEDEFGDPLYADAGPTPRLLELTRKHLRQLESQNQQSHNSVTA